MEQYQPLFLKYRPQSLADLVGQKYVALTLTNAIKHDRISHAYLFTGPRGTGKTSSARILAKSLNCLNGPTDVPCQTCTACVEIKQGNSTAVMEIDAASNNSVDDARILIERAPLVAAGGRFKLYIIDECHMLTKEAFNALLKTIEEPPPNVIFILATTEEHKVPPTIHSRCQRLMFRLINQTEMSEHLAKIAEQENINIDADALDLIARQSGGGLRDALGLLDQASLLSTPDHCVSVQDLRLLVGALAEDVLLLLSKSIIEADGSNTLALTNQLLIEGKEAHLIAGELARHLLNLAKATCFANDSKSETEISSLVKGSPKYIESLVELSRGLDRAELATMVEQLDRLEQACKRSSQPALNLEIGLLSLCHRLDLTNLKAIEQRIGRLEAQFSPSELEHSDNLDHAHRPVKKSVQTAPVEVKTSENLSEAKASVADTPKTPLSMPEPKSEPKEEQAETIELPNLAIDEILPKPAAAQEINSSDLDIDLIWSELLEELQKRHLPTFSLVSTHAFPVSLIENELTLGVLVENFQKMIENKIDHIQAASQTVTGKTLRVKVRIVDQSSASGHPGRAAKNREGKAGQKEQEALKRNQDERAIHEQVGLQSEVKQNLSQTQITTDKNAEMNRQQGLSHLIQDAYRLFEGPGSRLITASQSP